MMKIMSASYEDDFEEEIGNSKFDYEQEDFEKADEQDENLQQLKEVNRQGNALKLKSVRVTDQMRQRVRELSKFIKIDTTSHFDLFDLIPAVSYSNALTQIPDLDDRSDVEVETFHRLMIRHEDKYVPSVGKLFQKPVDVQRLLPFMEQSSALMHRIFAEESDDRQQVVDSSVTGLSDSFRVISTPGLSGQQPSAFHIDPSYIYLARRSGLLDIYSRSTFDSYRTLQLSKSFCTSLASLDDYLLCGCDDGTMLVFDLNSKNTYPAFTSNYGSHSGGDRGPEEFHINPVSRLSVLSKVSTMADIVSCDTVGNVALWKMQFNVGDDLRLLGMAYDSSVALTHAAWLSSGSCKTFCCLKDRILLAYMGKLECINRFGQSVTPGYYQVKFTTDHCCTPSRIEAAADDGKFALAFEEGYVAYYSCLDFRCICYFNIRTDSVICLGLSPYTLYAGSKPGVTSFDLETRSDSFVKAWNSHGDESKQSEIIYLSCTKNLYRPNASRLLVVLKDNEQYRIELHSVSSQQES